MSFSLASLGVQIKRLAGPSGFSTSTPGAVLYTVPSDGSVSAALILSITVVNARTDTNASLWSLYLVPSGATLSATTHAVVSNRPLSPSDLPDVFSARIAMSPGDALWGYATNGATIATISGVLLP